MDVQDATAIFDAPPIPAKQGRRTGTLALPNEDISFPMRDSRVDFQHLPQDYDLKIQLPSP